MQIYGCVLQDIIKIDRNKRYSQDRLANLKQEENNLKVTIVKEEQYVEKMKSVLDIVHKLTDPCQGLSLGQVAHMFTHLQVSYPFIVLNFEIVRKCGNNLL